MLTFTRKTALIVAMLTLALGASANAQSRGHSEQPAAIAAE